MHFTRLPLLSFLKVDVSYDIPIGALEEVLDGNGDQIMLRYIEAAFDSFNITSGASSRPGRSMNRGFEMERAS
jgi:hypothetical protein